MFEDDPLLKEQYQNFNGLVQFSKLFEDLDALAGNVAFKHCDDDDPETRPGQEAFVVGFWQRFS